MKNIYIIAYDISKTKKRNKVSELLEQYGERINLSVFECMMNSTQIKKLSIELNKIINTKTDKIKIYYICKTCYTKSFEIGKQKNKKNGITKFI